MWQEETDNQAEEMTLRGRDTEKDNIWVSGEHC